jgi:hypothetical protein
MRVYSRASGVLVWSAALSPTVIPAGDEREVSTAAIWTPDAVGSFLVTAAISCPGDMVPGNNFLSPTLIEVQELPTPPPGAVVKHAQQHQRGGGDELNVSGLRGVLADAQFAAPHRGSHERGGSDEIQVAGLRGKLADPQTPDTHGNEAHSVAFVTEQTVDQRIQAQVPPLIAQGISQHNQNANAHLELPFLANGQYYRGYGRYVIPPRTGQLIADYRGVAGRYLDLSRFRDRWGITAQGFALWLIDCASLAPEHSPAPVRLIFNRSEREIHQVVPYCAAEDGNAVIMALWAFEVETTVISSLALFMEVRSVGPVWVGNITLWLLVGPRGWVEEGPD